MRRIVLIVEHADNYTKKSADFRHLFPLYTVLKLVTPFAFIVCTTLVLS